MFITLSQVLSAGQPISTWQAPSSSAIVGSVQSPFVPQESLLHSCHWHDRSAGPWSAVAAHEWRRQVRDYQRLHILQRCSSVPWASDLVNLHFSAVEQTGRWRDLPHCSLIQTLYRNRPFAGACWKNWRRRWRSSPHVCWPGCSGHLFPRAHACSTNVAHGRSCGWLLDWASGGIGAQRHRSGCILIYVCPQEYACAY